MKSICVIVSFIKRHFDALIGIVKRAFYLGIDQLATDSKPRLIQSNNNNSHTTVYAKPFLLVYS